MDTRADVGRRSAEAHPGAILRAAETVGVRSIRVLQLRPNARPAADRLPANRDVQALFLVLDADAVVEVGRDGAGGEEALRQFDLAADDDRRRLCLGRAGLEVQLVLPAVD